VAEERGVRAAVAVRGRVRAAVRGAGAARELGAPGPGCARALQRAVARRAPPAPPPLPRPPRHPREALHRLPPLHPLRRRLRGVAELPPRLLPRLVQRRTRPAFIQS